jgi:predicted house-cleaning noncanonical NTP pyrophosphatase (MazG superfamily)
VPTYRKLVRDRIPELIRRNGGEPRIRRLSDEEFDTALARKLVEEAQEFAATPTAEELADVLEVVHALAPRVGNSVDEIETIRRAKAAERGAFDERLLLESVSYPDRAEEG